jgi:hypothetical protein
MLSETKSLIYVLKPGDHEAGVAGDSINMGLLNKVAYLVQFAAVTGDAVLTVKSGATAGTETTAETFRYRLADAAQAAAGADLFGDWATSSSLTLTAATYANKLTIAFSAAASALNASIVAVGEPRYKAHDGPTVI